jgi:ribosomal protection tetracycline resistance protein
VFGSATRGVGVAALLAAIKGLLPRASGDAAAPLDATVFKIERGAAPEKVAYVRMFSGTLHLHERLSRRGEPQGKATALRVFRGGSTSARPSLRAGEIGQVTGLERVAIGDRLGTACSSDSWSRSFPPPTLEAVVVPLRSADKTALSFALTELAEQDPLINVRQRAPQEFAVSLYGEVQKEVILATLSGDFGIDVEFRESAPICIERPIGRGAAVEYLGKHHNPFWATIGLAVEPIAIDAGVQFNVAVELGSMPLAFFKAVEESAREAFSEGNYGWRVTDCRVTMTHSGFLAPVSTAGDFRKLTPLVLMNALSRAKTRVYEPVQRFQLEIPADTLALMGPILTRVNARVRSTESMGAAWALEGDVPSSNVHELQRHLPALTRGEGVLECTFAGYRATRGNEVRRAPFHTPFDRKQYLARARQRS